ncbi:MAG TPA: hypothetical protein VJN43_11175 [Bryobacteraceae bacterium]|nr:hypothetical protein [Bryobacteraceae bacterium]
MHRKKRRIKPAAIDSPAKPAIPRIPDRLNRTTQIVCRVMLLCYITLISYPVAYFPIQAGGDPSWAFAMNYFHHKGLIFGRDVGFTYGPLAYLAIPMDLGTNLRNGILFQLGLWLILILVAGWAIFVRKLSLISVVLFAVALFGGLRLLNPLTYTGRDFFVSYLVLILLACSILADQWYVFYGIALLLASLLALIKFSTAIAVFGAICLLPASLIFFDRPRALRMGIFGLGGGPLLSCLLYLLYYPSLHSMLRYFVAGFEISSGYSWAMSLPVSVERFEIGCGILVCYALLVAALWFAKQKAFCLAWAGLWPLFVEFKHGFMREPSHEFIFFFFVPLLCGVLALSMDIKLKQKWYVTAALILLLAAWYKSEPGVLSWSVIANGRAGLPRVKALADLWHWEKVRNSLASISSYATRVDRLPPDLLNRISNQSIALFPQEATYAAANPINYRPFPIFQTYTVYTEYLDRRNAECFNNSATGPELILAEWIALEDRHPVLSVPATFTAMYRNYEFDSAYGARLLLQRRKSPLFERLRHVGARDLRMGQPLDLPLDEHPLIARIFLKPSIAGRLRAFLFQVPELNMVLCSDAPRCVFSRMPPGVLPGGVPINFVPEDLAGLEALFRGDPGVEPMHTVVLSGPGAPYFEPVVHVELFDAPDVKLNFAKTAPPGLGSRIDRGQLDSSKIESLNGVGVIGISERETVQVPDLSGFLDVEGWAVDPVSGCPSGPVYAELDGQLYATETGKVRGDIAALFGHRTGTACGFEWKFPAWKLGTAAHTLTIKILSTSQNGYWEGQRIRFAMTSSGQASP